MKDNDTKSKEKPLPSAKELYRKIVKKLHPDMNPDVTEHELELFHRATKAYEEGDIMTLQAIYECFVEVIRKLFVTILQGT